MTKVRVGVVGTGWSATVRHIPSYRRHPDAEVAVVFDRRPERARRVAEELSVPLAVSSLDEMFDRGVDVVSICTPPWTHAELASAALERGVHVFTEKPMAMDEGEATSMVEAARTAGRLLCVSHNFLFSRAVRRADRQLSDDRVGYAFGLQLSSLRRRLPDWYRELPGGLLLDESPHMLYTLQHFLGPLELEGTRASWDPESGLPRTAEIWVKGERGPGQVTMVFDTPLSEWHVGLVGRERAVDLDLFRDIAVSVSSDRGHGPADILRTSSRGIVDHTRGFVASGSRYAAGRLFWGHDVIIGRFVDAVLGRGPVPVPPEASVAVVRLTDAILGDLGLKRPQP